MSDILSISNLISEADMILVGIGEEFEAGLEILECSQIYKKYLEKVNKENLIADDYEWMLPFLLCAALRNEQVGEDIKAAYSRLAALLEGKNYFVISMNTDSLLEDSPIELEKTVSPFGSYRRLQCVCGCNNHIQDGSDYIETIASCINGDDNLSSTNQMRCSNCGREIIPNTVNSEKYLESGYIDQWGKYQKWLMGTVNHNLLILELGVTMQYPKLIRWPFEKMVSYNNKSKLVRVCKQFPYLTPETKDKGISIKKNAVEFVNELS